jgi:hypothetical protein
MIDFTMSSQLSRNFNQEISDTIDNYIESEMPVIIKIDGSEFEIEENTGEIERGSGEISINIDLGIRNIIKRHPEEYVDEMHYSLFTDEERDKLTRE